MKVLLTGHKGFVGSNLLNKLKELGHHVYCLEKNDNYEELHLESMVKQCKVIFHVGAISDTTLVEKINWVDTPLLNQFSYKVSDEKIKSLGWSSNDNIKKSITDTLSQLKNLNS